MSAPARPEAQRLSAAVTGAPLDLVKIVAAAAMVVDHTNKIVFGFTSLTCWYVGRLALPLFIFVLAMHVLRGAEPLPYLQRLIVLAVVSQPAYALAFASNDPNTVFTLAVGMAIAVLLGNQPRWVQHAAFAIGVIAVFTSALRPLSGLDFGIAGILFPAALLLAVGAPRQHLVWLLLFAFALNGRPLLAVRDEVAAFLITTLGCTAVIAVALWVRGGRRFVPGYAFYAFYPVHLLLLALLSAVR